MGRYAWIKSKPHGTESLSSKVESWHWNSLSLRSLNWAPLFIPELINYHSGPRDVRLWFVRLESHVYLWSYGDDEYHPTVIMERVVQEKSRCNRWKNGSQAGNNRKHPGLSSLSSSHCIEIHTSLMAYFQVKHYYLK